MTTPVYEVGIYTYKSPVPLSGSDIVAVTDVTRNDVSIGVNTIGDYDKYYISDTSPTFGATFIPRSVGTIEDAFASNSYGTPVSQTITNSFSVSESQLIVSGFIRPDPIIVSATLDVNQTYTPRIASFTGTLTVPYTPKLTVLSARITAPLYKCVSNKILKVFYYAHVRVTWKIAQLSGNGCGGNSATTVPVENYGVFNAPIYPVNSSLPNNSGPVTKFHYPNIFSGSFPGVTAGDFVGTTTILPTDFTAFPILPGLVVSTVTGSVPPTPLYQYASDRNNSLNKPSYFNSVGHFQGGIRGWGELPSSVLNSDETQVNDMTFYLNQDNNNTWSSTNDVNSIGGGGALTLNGRTGQGIQLVSSQDARKNATEQYGPSYFNMDKQHLETCCTCCNCIAGIARRIVDGRDVYADGFVNKKFAFNSVTIAVLFTDGGIYTPSMNVTTYVNAGHDVYDMKQFNFVAETKMSVPTSGNVSIDVDISQSINSSTQNIQLSSFKTNDIGIQASDTTTEYTLATQNSLKTLYDASPKGVKFAGKDEDLPGNVYMLPTSATLTASVRYQGGTASTVTATPLSTGTFNVTVTGTNVLTITQTNTIFNNFLQNILNHSNFNSTRALNITAGTNSLVSAYPSVSFDFASSLVNLYAKSPDNWGLSITYTPTVPINRGSVYRNGSNLFQSLNPRTFTTTFDSSGILTNATITRPTDEQAISVYERYDKTPLIRSYISGKRVLIPALSLASLGATVPSGAYSFNGASMPILVSFLGDPSNYDTYTITFTSSSAAVVLTASPLQLTYPGNATLRTFNLTSLLQAALSVGPLDIGLLVSSFNPSTNTIVAAGLQLDSNFYTESIAGATLNFTYRWGDEFNYKEYPQTISFATPTPVEIDPQTISSTSSTISLFNKADRQRLLLTGSTVLYFTTISANPTGYTFSQVPFPVRRWEPGASYPYIIHKLTSGILNTGDNAAPFLNINDNVDRTKPVRFISSPVYSNLLSTIELIGGGYRIYGDKVTAFTMPGTEVNVPLVNQFLQFDSPEGSLYLFVTPQLTSNLVGPLLAAETNPYIMPDYTGTASKTGIPTFGATLHGTRDYIITNNATQLANILNTFEYDKVVPFDSFTPGTISPLQVAGFTAVDYRYKYFEATTDSDNFSSLYAVPFNWNKSGALYNIAYANNYITLQFYDVDALWRGASQIIAPVITPQPLYTTIALNFELSNSGTNYTSADLSALYLKDSNKNILGEFTNTGNNYSVEFIASNFIPGTIYSEYDEPLYISPVFNSNFTIPDYVVRRIYIPESLVVTSAPSFISASFATSAQLFRTTLNINLQAGGSISYAGNALTGFADVQKRFAIMIQGIPEITFDIAANGTASILIPHLLPATYYNGVSIRYYPYRTHANPKLRELSEVAFLTGFNFTTPPGYKFSAGIVLTYDPLNMRACSITVNRASLTSGTQALDISGYELVLETDTTVRIESGATFSHGILTVPATYASLTYYLTEMVHGQIVNPIVYIQKTNTLVYKSNLVFAPVVKIPVRDNIIIDVLGNLLYQKEVSLTNYDVYEQFLVKDFSLPENFGGEIQILNGTTGFSYGSTGPTGSSLILDLNNLESGTYSDLNVCYSRNHFVPLALTQMVRSDKTGMRDQKEIRNFPNFYDTFDTKSGFSPPPLNQNVILYGSIVRARYKNSTTYNRINYAVNSRPALVSLVEFFSSNGATTIYDPRGVYISSQGGNAGVLSKLNSDRIDSLGNTDYHYQVNSYTAATGTTMGTVSTTYSQGYAYYGEELNEFYDKVIAIKVGTVPIFIVYLETGTIYLSDYVQTNVGFTADACIYNGYSIELSYPEDVDNNITVYRDTFPSYRDSIGSPTYRLDDFFTRIPEFNCVYFQTQSQIDAWNSSSVSYWWWTSSLPRLKQCPFQILNKLTSVGLVPPVVVVSRPQVMSGQVITSPAMFYGSVRINNFQYYSVDPINNSFPVFYKGGTLRLVDSFNVVYGSVSVPPVYAQDITITLDKRLLTQNTTYDLTLVYIYTEANLVGKSTLPVLYVVPPDETLIRDYTENELIHKLNIIIEPGNTFGNLPLSSIIMPSKLSLNGLARFNYSGEWNSSVSYTDGSLVVLRDNQTLYWLTDIVNYKPGSPAYGHGWINMSRYLFFRGEWSGSGAGKFEVVSYNGGLYKALSPQSLAPTILDRDTGLYSDYTTNIFSQSVVLPYAFAGPTALNYTFEYCVPNLTYDVTYSLNVGNTYSSPISLGNYTLLPAVLDCQGVTFDNTEIVLKDVSYEKSSDYFRDGLVNYQGSTFAFQGTGVTIAYTGTISSVTYTPQLSIDIGIPDETDQYVIYPVGLTLICDIQGPVLTHNSAIFQISNFEVPPIILNTNDYIGVFEGTTLFSEFQLTDSVMLSKYQGYNVYDNFSNFALPIENLNSFTLYPDFKFQFRVNNTPNYIGIPIQLPPFTTPPILVLRILIAPGISTVTARITSITYASNVIPAPALFPTTNVLNNIAITLQNSQSMKTKTPFMSKAGVSTNSRSVNIDINNSGGNPNNYLYNFMVIAYTFVDNLGNLRTLDLAGEFPESYVTRPQTINYLI